MASRMGFDLTTRMGRKNLKYVGWKCAKYHFLRDTFAKSICFIVGHIEYDTGYNKIACKRCCKYIKK